MIFRTTVELGNDDAFLYTPDGAAAQVLAALGGNATKDTAYVYVQQSASGSAGAQAPPAAGDAASAEAPAPEAPAPEEPSAP